VVGSTGHRLPGSAIAGGFLGFFVSGAVISLYGPSAPAFRRIFEVTELTSGLPASVHPLLAFAGVLSWVWVVGRVGPGPSLSAGMVVLSCGAIGVALAPSMPAVLGAVILIGAGFGVLANGMNTVFPRDSHPRTAVRVGWMHGAFGAGAVLLPLVFSLLGYRAAFLLVGVLGFAAVPLLHTTSGPTTTTLVTSPPRTSRRTLIWFGLLFATYVGMEAATHTWMATYIEFRGATERAAAQWTSGYWLLFTIGRFAFAPLLGRLAPGRLVRMVLPVVVALLLLAMIPAIAPYAMAAAGLAMAPIFPAGMVWLARALPEAGGATTVAVLAAMAGASVSPFLVGSLATAAGTASIPAGLVLLATGCGVVAHQVRNHVGDGQGPVAPTPSTRDL